MRGGPILKDTASSVIRRIVASEQGRKEGKLEVR